MPRLRLPQPPAVTNDISGLHRSLTDVISFLRQLLDEGSKHAAFTQAEIDTFTDPLYLGTILFNSDTNESNVSFLDGGGNVQWRSV